MLRRGELPVLRWRRVNSFHLMFVEPDAAVPDELAISLMEALDDPTLQGYLAVIGNDGFAKLTLRQMQGTASILRRYDYSIAVLTSNRVSLAIIRSAEWNGVNIRGFRGLEFDDALEWIGVDAEHRPNARAVIRELRDGVSPFN